MNYTALICRHALGFALLGGVALGLAHWLGGEFTWAAVGGGAVLGAVLGAIIGFDQYRRLCHADEIQAWAAGLGAAHTGTIAREELDALVGRGDTEGYCRFDAARHRLTGLPGHPNVEMVDVGVYTPGRKGWRDVTAVILPAADWPAFTLLAAPPLERPPAGRWEVPFAEPAGAGEAVRAFHKQYILIQGRGRQESRPDKDTRRAIREIFHLGVLEFFAANPGWNIQAQGGKVLIWKGKGVVPAAGRDELLRAAGDVFGRLPQGTPREPVHVVEGPSWSLEDWDPPPWLKPLALGIMAGTAVGTLAVWAVLLVYEWLWVRPDVPNMAPVLLPVFLAYLLGGTGVGLAYWYFRQRRPRTTPPPASPAADDTLATAIREPGQGRFTRPPPAGKPTQPPSTAIRRRR